MTNSRNCIARKFYLRMLNDVIECTVRLTCESKSHFIAMDQIDGLNHLIKSQKFTFFLTFIIFSYLNILSVAISNIASIDSNRNC